MKAARLTKLAAEAAMQQKELSDLLVDMGDTAGYDISSVTANASTYQEMGAEMVKVIEDICNSNAIMITAMFVVSAGFNRTQFVKNCAASVNKIARGSLTRVMLGYVLIAALLAQFIQSSVIVFGIMATPAVPMCMAMGGYALNSTVKQSIIPAGIFRSVKGTGFFTFWQFASTSKRQSA